MSNCTVCPAGKTQDSDTTDNATCRWCPSGRFLLDDARIDAAKHDNTTQDCLTCVRGKEFADRVSNCTVCHAGKTQDSDTTDNATCRWCPAGRYLLDDAQIDPDNHDNATEDCLRCTVGHEFTTQTSNCTICRAGHYQNSSLVDNATCVACPIGRYLLDDSQLPQAHANQSQCLYCLPGTNFTRIDTDCHVCPAGFYKPEYHDADARCKECPVGRYITDKGLDRKKHEFQNQCLNCTVGRIFEKTSEACRACAFGRYQDENERVETVCKACPVDTFISDHRGDAT